MEYRRAIQCTVEGCEKRYVPSPHSATTSASGRASFAPTAAPPHQPSEPPPLEKSVPGRAATHVAAHDVKVGDRLAHHHRVVAHRLAHGGGQVLGRDASAVRPFVVCELALERLVPRGEVRAALGDARRRWRRSAARARPRRICPSAVAASAR